MTVYRVEGMACDGCATSIIRALQGVAADARVVVDLDAATIDVDGIDDRAAIAAAVDAAGFTFVGPV